MHAVSNLLARRHAVALAAALIVVALAVAMSAAAARADFGIAPGSFATTLSSTQAGGATDLTTAFAMNMRADGWPDGNLKNLGVDLPTGLIGDPTAVPRCPEAKLLVNKCPDAAAVGTVDINLGFGFPQHLGTFAVYNMVPAEGETAQLGANAALQVRLRVRVRSEGDYGLTTTMNNTTSGEPLTSSTVVLWGVPADPSHDAIRGSCLNAGFPTGNNCPSGSPRRAFLRNAPTCGPQQPATIAVNSWQDPSTTVSATADMPDITGCEHLPPIEPKASVQAADRSTGSPSGYDVDLDIPQVTNPDAVATPPLSAVTIDFPSGTAISPGSADGLGACTDAQLHQHDRSAAECPDASKIGSVSIKTPYLPDPLEGAMYLGQPRPDDQFRLFLVAEGSGVSVRQVGSAVPDPKTGHLTATFSDLPPVAFSHLRVHMKGGPRAVLVNPTSCGTAMSMTTVTPYGGGDAASDASSFDVGGNCAPPGFAPELSAGTTNPVAGADSPFVLQLRRGDGQQDLQAVGVDLPAGLIGKVAGLPLCPSAQAAAGACGAESRVGSVQATVGTGSNPITLPGSVYMTEGYGGGPFGLDFVVPAKIGPFDFGNVNVRASVKVDPFTGALRVQTDPMPSIIAGIPLHYRALTVNLDRAGFMRNPTSCLERQISASLTSTAGATASPSTRFQVAGCGDLPLAPVTKMTLNGVKERKRGGKPGLSVVLTQKPGQSNLKTVKVTLPKAVGIALGLPAPCTVEQFTARDCPAASKLGDSSVTTPLLDGPLQGGVYLVTGDKGQLPRLGVLLNGQVAISLLSTVRISHARVVTTFPAPDLPISQFKLTLNTKTALASQAHLCKAKQKANVKVTGATGAVTKKVVTVPVQGCPTKKKSKSTKK